MLKKIQNQKAFTLVEIMIVVAILGLLAALTIPNLLRARVNSNEGAIKSAMKTFSSANESYRSAQATPTYAADVSSLTSPTPPYLDVTWDAGARNGFDLVYTPAAVPAATYSFLATPTASSWILNSYCVDQSGTVVFGAGTVTADETGCAGGVPLSG